MNGLVVYGYFVWVFLKEKGMLRESHPVWEMLHSHHVESAAADYQENEPPLFARDIASAGRDYLSSMLTTDPTVPCGARLLELLELWVKCCAEDSACGSVSTSMLRRPEHWEQHQAVFFSALRVAEQDVPPPSAQEVWDLLDDLSRRVSEARSFVKIIIW